MASYSDAMVPVVSFEELLHSDWNRLPAPLANGFNGNRNVVVCTHLDQVSQENMRKELNALSVTSWPGGLLNTGLLIPCSSLTGLSATDLVYRTIATKLPRTKLPFESIWERHTVGYHVRGPLFSIACAE